jgi:hypothetical protein
MMAVLVGAGTVLLLAGLAAIGYGIPYRDFSLGSTTILSGVIAACSGAIILGLWVVARQLQTIAHGLGAGASLAPQAGRMSDPAGPRGQPGDPGGFLFSGDQPAAENAGAAGQNLPPWQGEEPAAEGELAQAQAASPPAEAAPPPKPKRNLLFSSSSRKERERAASRTSEPLAPDLLSPDLRPPPSAASAPPEPVEPPPPPSFDDAWPQPERARPGEAPPPRRAVRPPLGSANPGGAAREAPPQVTVLKSGVVDGMAYSLYSDGSIEAQMPEGMMRFASIDELRAHLDHRP